MDPNASGLGSHVVCPKCQATNRIAEGRPMGGAKCGSCHESLFVGRASAVDEAAFAKHIAKNDIPVLVDMWAPWCGPCRQMAPQFEKAAQALEPNLRLLKLNIDEAPSTAQRFNVRGIPALLLFKGGRVVGQSAGVQTANKIVAWARSELQP